MVSVQKGIIYGAMLESFLIHTRNLYDFLYGWEYRVPPKQENIVEKTPCENLKMAKRNKNDGEDDIGAEMFFDDGKQQNKWKDERNKYKPSYIRKNYVHINKGLAHLTLSRINGDQHIEWKYEQINKELLEPIQVFQRLVDDKRKGKRWIGYFHINEKLVDLDNLIDKTLKTI